MLLDIFIKAGCDQRLGAGAGASIFFSGALLPLLLALTFKLLAIRKKILDIKTDNRGERKSAIWRKKQLLDVYRRYLRGKL